MGQNLAAGDYDVGWGNIVKLWYDEVKDFTMNGTNNFARVGHYTQVPIHCIKHARNVFFDTFLTVEPLLFLFILTHHII